MFPLNHTNEFLFALQVAQKGKKKRGISKQFHFMRKKEVKISLSENDSICPHDSIYVAKYSITYDHKHRSTHTTINLTPSKFHSTYHCIIRALDHLKEQ